jgi:nucleoside-diphosphate-sugar epimerase
MNIAVTGATGFLGRYLVRQFAGAGHQLRCWHRPESDRTGLDGDQDQIEWRAGQLGDVDSARSLVEGCDAVVHSALFRTSKTFQGAGEEEDVLGFLEKNFMGTIRLIEAARAAGVGRFVFVATCAVHEKILDDRPLDETHPLWPKTHYGAHKAALEKFVHSYGLGQGYPICSLRPTGIYGVAHPVEDSKFFDLVQAVARGEDVKCRGGGKEVHAADVARAAEILLAAEDIAGEAYSCYDQYISRYDVATITKELTGGTSVIDGQPTEPKHQIVTNKLRGLGMQFGGRPLLEETIREMLAAL